MHLPWLSMATLNVLRDPAGICFHYIVGHNFEYMRIWGDKLIQRDSYYTISGCIMTTSLQIADDLTIWGTFPQHP
jgi:hypothetical protein